MLMYSSHIPTIRERRSLKIAMTQGLRRTVRDYFTPQNRNHGNMFHGFGEYTAS